MVMRIYLAAINNETFEIWRNRERHGWL